LINKFKARGSGYELERTLTKFVEIMQCNGHYAVQGHSRSPILVPIESSMGDLIDDDVQLLYFPGSQIPI